MTILTDQRRRDRRTASGARHRPRPERDEAVGRRTIAPSRGLPNGRAVLGGLLVALAGLGSYLLATGGNGEPTASYVVAAHDLAPGETVVDGDVELVALDLPAEQSRGTFDAVEPLRGAVMRGPLQAGAIVTASAVDQLPPAAAEAAARGASDGLDAAGGTDLTPADAGVAYRELALSLPADRAVGGALRPGDRVDVVATDGPTSYVLAQHIVVLSAGSGRGGPLGGGDVNVTLALPDPASALAVAHGAAAAEVTLLRSTRVADTLPASFQLSDAGSARPLGTTVG